MKREIKFKFYSNYYEDDKTKYRLYPDVLTLNHISTGDYSEENEIQHGIPCQFTGLTNNGQEWYEGDILENDTDWYQIEWDNDDAMWRAVGIRSTGESLGLSELLSQETWVQGNIYQNPELLS